MSGSFSYVTAMQSIFFFLAHPVKGSREENDVKDLSLEGCCQSQPPIVTQMDQSQLPILTQVHKCPNAVEGSFVFSSYSRNKKQDFQIPRGNVQIGFQL